MKIGLIDIDSHNFPNLPLMKISAYHKKQGDEVEMCIPLKKYDVVYQSKIFTNTKDISYTPQAEKIFKGGTGYDLKNRLNEKIEKQYPDYDLYPMYKDIAYGFLTRGCPRDCKFCIVGKKEGLKTYKVADLEEFWKGQKIVKLLDPNITACKEKEELFNQLINSKAKIDFTQGLDVRLITEKDISQINQMRLKNIHFAWDNYEMKTYEKLKKIRSLLKNRQNNPAVYVLVNFDTNHEQDLERIYKLKELKYDPYVMIYEKEKAEQRERLLQRWVNNKIIFKTVKTFGEYDRKKG